MKNDLQITTRLPREVFKDKEKTLPRDNPVKDFLLSANEKFKAHKALRPDTYGILTIVWDDFSHEAVAALVSPVSGLLTSNSFFRNSVGETITFPNVDGIVICRYQHWIAHTFGNVPLDDPAYGRTRFLQYRVSEPPKAFVQNPSGRDVPEPLLKALDALPLSECQGAEYSPIEMIFWT